MPKARLPQNKALPKRWSLRRGVYYYAVPSGDEHNWNGRQLFRLGRTWEEASATWRERTGARTWRKGDLLRDLASEWGITPGVHESLMARQRRRCALCEKPFADIPAGRTRPFVVDHCHESGAIRGYLCHACNLIEGSLAKRGIDPTKWARRLRLYYSNPPYQETTNCGNSTETAASP